MTLILKTGYTNLIFSILLTTNIVSAKLWLFKRERIFVDVTSKLNSSQLKSKTSSQVDKNDLCGPFYYYAGRDIKQRQRTGKHSFRMFIECRLNKCSCLNGVAAKQTCHTDGIEECATCNVNFHKFGDSCQLNKCSCENGVPASVNTVENCEVHGAEQCSDCQNGYHKSEDGTCERNICACENGFPRMGNKLENLCTENFSNQCEYCDAGFHLTGDTCTPNVCQCVNGHADNGTHIGHICNTHTANECSDCDNFHHLLGETCQKNKCLCQNGIRDDENCLNHNEYNCKSCFQGFTLSDESGGFCLPNKCECENGFPGQCFKTGETSCSACFEGYHLHNNECVENTCQCPDGLPAVMSRTGILCTIHGAHECVQCNDGYRLNEFNECIKSICQCTNGVAGVHCETQNGFECSECNDGYTFCASSMTCQKVCPSFSFKMTTCKKSGNIGPSQAMCDQAYSASDNSVEVIQGIQYFTVPVTGVFRVEAVGASGGCKTSGHGATISGNFQLVAAEKLAVLVGQQGTCPRMSMNGYVSGGGGGATFVIKSSGVDAVGLPLLIAGGGGGAQKRNHVWGKLDYYTDASTTNCGNSADDNISIVCNGTGGLGLLGGASGGAGLFEDGGLGEFGRPGKSFVNGGNGGVSTLTNSKWIHYGGFGGGAASDGTSGGGAGGGGYSGGSASYNQEGDQGAGGGSSNSGSDQVGHVSELRGHGFVRIFQLF